MYPYVNKERPHDFETKQFNNIIKKTNHTDVDVNVLSPKRNSDKNAMGVIVKITSQEW